MAKAIPDRWLNYRPIGQRVPGTRFIAFKVPLRENINNTVDDEELRLAPHSLLKSVPDLGLIVDLTNTSRYYDPQSFTNENVEHQKLFIPGRQTPPMELSQRFCQYVNQFLKANADNDKLIGVHCTHGVNRTGYMICYYMILNMNIAPALAIQTFADARGHKIERENFTKSLHHLNRNSESRHLSRNSESRHRQEDERPTNWRSKTQDWQTLPQQHHHQQHHQPQQQRHQWRNSSRSDDHEDVWQGRNRRWEQPGYSEERRSNGRYQNQRDWQPQQQSGRYHEAEEQSYSNYNNYSRTNNYRGSNNSDSNNYSRNHHHSRSNILNRPESRTNSNRYHRYADQA